MKPTLFLALGLLVSAFALAQLGLLAGTRPADLGVHDARLKPPSATRNSVSSQAALYPDHPQHDYATIKPLPQGSRSGPGAMAALLSILQNQPNIKVLEVQADYVYAEAQTPWLKFVDDLEFWLNPALGVIEVRSASRLGREDFGTNRERIESIRRAYLALPE